MKKLLVFIALIVAVVLIVPRALEKVQTGMAEDDARRRVTMILEAMKKDPADEQTATCLWMADTLVLPRDEMERAWDKWYPIWRNLPLAEPEGWVIESVEAAGSDSWRVKLVKGTQTVRLQLTPKQQIQVLD